MLRLPEQLDEVHLGAVNLSNTVITTDLTKAYTDKIFYDGSIVDFNLIPENQKNQPIEITQDQPPTPALQVSGEPIAAEVGQAIHHTDDIHSAVIGKNCHTAYENDQGLASWFSPGFIPIQFFKNGQLIKVSQSESALQQLVFSHWKTLSRWHKYQNHSIPKNYWRSHLNSLLKTSGYTYYLPEELKPTSHISTTIFHHQNVTLFILFKNKLLILDPSEPSPITIDDINSDARNIALIKDTNHLLILNKENDQYQLLVHSSVTPFNRIKKLEFSTFIPHKFGLLSTVQIYEIDSSDLLIVSFKANNKNYLAVINYQNGQLQSLTETDYQPSLIKGNATIGKIIFINLETVLSWDYTIPDAKPQIMYVSKTFVNIDSELLLSDDSVFLKQGSQIHKLDTFNVPVKNGHIGYIEEILYSPQNKSTINDCNSKKHNIFITRGKDNFTIWNADTLKPLYTHKDITDSDYVKCCLSTCGNYVFFSQERHLYQLCLSSGKVINHFIDGYYFQLLKNTASNDQYISDFLEKNIVNFTKENNRWFCHGCDQNGHYHKLEITDDSDINNLNHYYKQFEHTIYDHLTMRREQIITHLCTIAQSKLNKKIKPAVISPNEMFISDIMNDPNDANAVLILAGSSLYKVSTIDGTTQQLLAGHYIQNVSTHHASGWHIVQTRKALNIYNRNGYLIHQIKDQYAHFSCFLCSPLGNFLALYNFEKNLIKIYDKNLKLKTTISVTSLNESYNKFYDGPLFKDVHFSQCGRYFFIAHSKCSISCFDLEDNCREILCFSIPRTDINRMQSTHDDRLLISTNSGTLYLYSLNLASAQPSAILLKALGSSSSQPAEPQKNCTFAVDQHDAEYDKDQCADSCQNPTFKFDDKVHVTCDLPIYKSLNFTLSSGRVITLNTINSQSTLACFNQSSNTLVTDAVEIPPVLPEYHLTRSDPFLSETIVHGIMLTNLNNIQSCKFIPLSLLFTTTADHQNKTRVEQLVNHPSQSAIALVSNQHELLDTGNPGFEIVIYDLVNSKITAKLIISEQKSGTEVSNLLFADDDHLIFYHPPYIYIWNFKQGYNYRFFEIPKDAEFSLMNVDSHLEITVKSTEKSVTHSLSFSELFKPCLYKPHVNRFSHQGDAPQIQQLTKLTTNLHNYAYAALVNHNIILWPSIDNPGNTVEIPGPFNDIQFAADGGYIAAIDDTQKIRYFACTATRDTAFGTEITHQNCNITFNSSPQLQPSAPHRFGRYDHPNDPYNFIIKPITDRYHVTANTQSGHIQIFRNDVLAFKLHCRAFVTDESLSVVQLCPHGQYLFIAGAYTNHIHIFDLTQNCQLVGEARLYDSSQITAIAIKTSAIHNEGSKVPENKIDYMLVTTATGGLYRLRADTIIDHTKIRRTRQNRRSTLTYSGSQHDITAGFCHAHCPMDSNEAYFSLLSMETKEITILKRDGSPIKSFTQPDVTLTELTPYSHDARKAARCILTVTDGWQHYCELQPSVSASPGITSSCAFFNLDPTRIRDEDLLRDHPAVVCSQK